jgi:hypothetical protein
MLRVRARYGCKLRTFEYTTERLFDGFDTDHKFLSLVFKLLKLLQEWTRPLQKANHSRSVRWITAELSTVNRPIASTFSRSIRFSLSDTPLPRHITYSKAP